MSSSTILIVVGWAVTLAAAYMNFIANKKDAEVNAINEKAINHFLGALTALPAIAGAFLIHVGSAGWGLVFVIIGSLIQAGFFVARKGPASRLDIVLLVYGVAVVVLLIVLVLATHPAA